MHFNRTRTVRFSSCRGGGGGLSRRGCVLDNPAADTPLGRHPQADTPWTDTPRQTFPVPLHSGIHIPSPIACWDTHPLSHCILGYIPPWTEVMTHACKNITFPQLFCLNFVLVTSIWRLASTTASFGFWGAYCNDSWKILDPSESGDSLEILLIHSQLVQYWNH